MLLSFIVVAIVLLVSGKGINLAVWWYLPIIILQETLLAFGLTLLVAGITVYFRDMQFLLNIIMMAWQFLSPVMYSVYMVPDNFRGIFNLNPMTPIIVAYRDVLYYKQAPHLHTFILGTVMGVAMLMIGCFSFGKLKKHFAEVL